MNYELDAQQPLNLKVDINLNAAGNIAQEGETAAETKTFTIPFGNVTVTSGAGEEGAGTNLGTFLDDICFAIGATSSGYRGIATFDIL